MAMAAFKSGSRRPTTTTTRTKSSSLSDKEPSTTTRQQNQHHRLASSPTKKTAPPRRSRSVSAAPRANLVDTYSPSPTTAAATEADFLIKRDNPLYWSNVSPPDEENKDVSNEIGTNEVEFEIEPTKSDVVDGDSRRGRSVSRNGDAGRKSGIGRSLSRVDTNRRGRSVSGVPVSRGYFFNSESDFEQEGCSSMKYRNGSDMSKVSNVGRDGESMSRSYGSSIDKRSLQTRSDADLHSLPDRSSEDGALGNSFSEAEERTIKAVYEQMKSFPGNNLEDDTSSRIYETVRSEVRRAIADIQNDLESAIRRSNASAIAMDNVTDIPPDLVNPNAVELVMDIRREYAHKFDQSQERARKLRADLAVEEHRGLELSRILKQVLPDPKMSTDLLQDPKTSTVQKPRHKRKSSIERRKMSKRLTEEAMAYFDECVSISTFDSSDLSSQEDPPINLVGAATLLGDRVSFPQASSSIASHHYPSNFPDDKQEIGSTCSPSASLLSTTGASKGPALDDLETPWSRRFQFSFARKPNDASDLQQDIRKYAKSFEKDRDKADTNANISSSTHFDLDEYKLAASRQNFLFDRVLFKNRIQSGGMLLCDGGIAVSVSPFATVI